MKWVDEDVAMAENEMKTPEEIDQIAQETYRYNSAIAMRDRVNAVEDGSFHDVRCIGGERVFYIADSKARIPGHIYSEAGVREYQISGVCEYHFDKATLPEDED